MFHSSITLTINCRVGVNFIDAYTDPLSWLSSPSTKQSNTNLCDYTTLQNIIQALPSVGDPGILD